MAKNLNISKLNGLYAKAKELRLVKNQTEFAKLLGYSRSQYNKQMAGTFPISNDTVDVAERVVAGGTKAVTRETLLMESLLKRQNSLIELQNNILVDLKENMYDKVKNIEVNLKSVRGQAEGIELELLSGRTVLLQSLSRLEGHKDNFLLEKADNIKTSLAEAKNEHYRNSGGGIKSSQPA